MEKLLFLLRLLKAAPYVALFIGAPRKAWAMLEAYAGTRVEKYRQEVVKTVEAKVRVYNSAPTELRPDLILSLGLDSRELGLGGQSPHEEGQPHSAQVGSRRCLVSYRDAAGVRHSVVVHGSGLHQVACYALAEFRARSERSGEPPGPATELTVEVELPHVEHVVRVSDVMRWLEGISAESETALENVG